MLSNQKIQTNKQNYINFIKNLARLGAGSALVLVHVAILGGTAILSKRAAKKKLQQNSVKSLPYEK